MRNKLYRISQIKAPLSFNDIGKLADNVPVLAVEGQLYLSLVVIEFLCTHGGPPGCGLARFSLARERLDFS